MKKFFTKKKIIIGILLLVAIFIALKVKNGDNGSELITVARGDVVQEILVTGKLKSLSTVDLGFDRAGRVSRSYKTLGDSVFEGEVVAELDVSSELADLGRQKALLAEERAKLGGSRESLASDIREGFASADNAIRNKADQFFKQPRTNPAFEVKFTDGNYEHYFNVPSNTALEINNGRREVETLLIEWQKEIQTLTNDNAEALAEKAIQRMNKISAFLDNMAYAINSFVPADFAYESTVAGYKTAIDSARSSISSSRSSIITTKESLGAFGASQSIAEAKIDQINSAIAGIEALIAKSKIKAPFSGTLTLQDAKVGAVASPGQKLVSIIAERNLVLEANISEVNIGKVQVGNKVRIEFDAFPGEVFEGDVVYIEPGETVMDGVVYYKTQVFVPFEDRLKSGMTANLNIETAKIENALSIPVYAVKKVDGKNFVTKVAGEQKTEVEIGLGLQGSDGKVEITSGLTDGDVVEY